MDPVLFTTTIDAMHEVSSSIEKYISYAKVHTGRKPTAPYALMEASLKAFYKEVFVADFENMYK